MDTDKYFLLFKNVFYLIKKCTFRLSGVLRRLVGPVLLVLGGVVFGLAVLSYPSMYIGRQQLTNKQAVHYLLKFY